jgi:hypothetical protein
MRFFVPQAGQLTTIFSMAISFTSQSRIDVARAAALRGVAGYIYKLTFLFAAGACFWWRASGNPETALAAFPECHSALRAYVPHKTAFSRITALSAHHFIRHDSFLP